MDAFLMVCGYILPSFNVLELRTPYFDGFIGNAKHTYAGQQPSRQ